jgi:hypothetical protein
MSETRPRVEGLVDRRRPEDDCERVLVSLLVQLLDPQTERPLGGGERAARGRQPLLGRLAFGADLRSLDAQRDDVGLGLRELRVEPVELEERAVGTGGEAAVLALKLGGAGAERRRRIGGHSRR